MPELLPDLLKTHSVKKLGKCVLPDGLALRLGRGHKSLKALERRPGDFDRHCLPLDFGLGPIPGEKVGVRLF